MILGETNNVKQQNIYIYFWKLILPQGKGEFVGNVSHHFINRCAMLKKYCSTAVLDWWRLNSVGISLVVDGLMPVAA